MYKILLEAHSGLRFIVLILLVISILTALAGWLGNKDYTKGNQGLNLFTFIFSHIQLLIGLILYFVSPNVQLNNMGAAMKDSSLRYWAVEHVALMIFSIALITIGYTKAKKLLSPIAKHRRIAIFYGLALVVIVVTILMSGRPLLGMSR
jgi:hypothetical protein